MERKEKEVKYVPPFPQQGAGQSQAPPGTGSQEDASNVYKDASLAICRLDFKNQTSSIMENFKHIPK